MGGQSGARPRRRHTPPQSSRLPQIPREQTETCDLLGESNRGLTHMSVKNYTDIFGLKLLITAL